MFSGWIKESYTVLRPVALTLRPRCGTVRALLIRPSLQIRRCSVGGLILSGDVFSIAVFFEEVK